MITIYHNPNCSKSRESLRLLTESGNEIEVVEYLKNPPSKNKLMELSKLLGLKPSEFTRKKEAVITEENIDLSSEEKVLEAMTSYPKIIERPIIVNGDRAVIGRPPEKVKDIL